MHCAEEWSAFTSSYLSMRCSTKQPVSSARALDFLLPDIGPNYSCEWKERLERFSGDFRRFPNILFTLHETAGLSELFACPRKNGKNESTTSVNGNVPAAWIVKEFSAGCGTRSFLGDDVLKFTVGVRRQSSSDRYTLNRTNSTNDFYSSWTRRVSPLGNA